jgi:outer membrane protein assembly factor BamB
MPGRVGRDGARAGRGAGPRWRRPLAVAAAAAVLLLAAGAVVHSRGAGGSAGCAQQRPLAPRPAGASGIGLSTWTVFEASPAHDLVLPATLAGGTPLAVSWEFHTRGEISTAPSVVDGVAYFGSSDQCVYAVNVVTGREIWSFHTANMVMSEPLVVDGRVFVGSGNKTVISVGSGYLRGTGQSGVYALDARTGRLLWHFPTPGEVMATLLYQDGTVYAATGNSAFYALDAATGRLLWKVQDGSIDSMSSVAAAGHTAIFGGADPYAVYGINLQQHRLAWETQLGKGTPWDAEGGIDDVSPAISGHLAYIQNPEGVFPSATVVEFALDAQSGRIVWQTELGQGTITEADREEAGVATVVDGVLYVGSPIVPGLWALNAATGSPLWKVPIPVGLRATPTVTAHHIYAAGSGWVYVLNRLTGSLQAAVHLSTPAQAALSCASPPVTIVGQTALVMGPDANTLMAVPLRELMDGTAAALPSS